MGSSLSSASSCSSSSVSRIYNLSRHLQPSHSCSDTVKGAGFIKLSPEVSEALSNGRAVVALESTIISHGLSMEELGRLATLGNKAQKTARRDVAHVVSNP